LAQMGRMIGLTNKGYISAIQLTSGRSSSGLDECYELLTAAIIKQAVKDYEAVLVALFHKPTGIREIRLQAEKADLERFFHSQWYEFLTEIDGDRLIEAAKRNAVEKEKAAIRRRMKKKLKKMGHTQGYGGAV